MSPVGPSIAESTSGWKTSTLLNPGSMEGLIDVILCRPEVLATMGKCRDKYEEETDVKRKAILSQKYLAVLFYTEIPPQRGKEYQSMVLRVCRKGKLPAPGTDSRHAPNCLYIAEDGSEGYIKIAD